MRLESMGHDNEVEVERFRRSLGVIKYGCGYSTSFPWAASEADRLFRDSYNLEFRPMKLSTP
jgi:hypothetical protein